MKMFTIKNVLKLTTGVAAAFAISLQAHAGTVALAGSYGNYIQPGCAWTFISSNNYGPTSGVPIGATTNGVNVVIHYLVCSGIPGPQAVKVVVTNFSFIYPNWNSRTQTGQPTCNLSSAQSIAEGTCENHRIYN